MQSFLNYLSRFKIILKNATLYSAFLFGLFAISILVPGNQHAQAMTDAKAADIVKLSQVSQQSDPNIDGYDLNGLEKDTCAFLTDFAVVCRAKGNVEFLTLVDPTTTGGVVQFENPRDHQHLDLTSSGYVLTFEEDSADKNIMVSMNSQYLNEAGRIRITNIAPTAPVCGLLTVESSCYSASQLFWRNPSTLKLINLPADWKNSSKAFKSGFSNSNTCYGKEIQSSANSSSNPLEIVGNAVLGGPVKPAIDFVINPAGFVNGLVGKAMCEMSIAIGEATCELIGCESGAGILITSLTISPLDTTDSAGPGQGLQRGWQIIRDISLGFYTIVFLVILFGNSLGMDNYTVKKALPRLALGAIFTFASFFIVKILIDISNVLGTAIPNLFFTISGENGFLKLGDYIGFSGGNSRFPSTFTIFLLLILSIIAFVAVLIALITFVVRQFIVYLLVLSAPLAFLAWVLPNTEKLFKKWWSSFIRVLMMFPIATAMIGGSLFFSSVVAGSGNPGGFQILAAATAPLLALIMLPKTYKWGGEAFAVGAGFIAGRISTGQKAGFDKAKESKTSGYIGQGLNKMAEIPGLNLIPGVGGFTKRKRFETVGGRQSAFTRKMSTGLEKMSDDNVVNLYNSLSQGRKATPYGKAIQSELLARQGKNYSEYASGHREGRDTNYLYNDAKDGKIHKVGRALGATDQEIEERINQIHISGLSQSTMPSAGKLEVAFERAIKSGNAELAKIVAQRGVRNGSIQMDPTTGRIDEALSRLDATYTRQLNHVLNTGTPPPPTIVVNPSAPGAPRFDV